MLTEGWTTSAAVCRGSPSNAARVQKECAWNLVLHPACREKGVHQSCCISSRLASSQSASPTSQTTCSHRAQGRPSPARRKDQGLRTRRSYPKLLPSQTVNLCAKDVTSEHAIPALADVRKRMHNRVSVEIRLQFGIKCKADVLPTNRTAALC